MVVKIWIGTQIDGIIYRSPDEELDKYRPIVRLILKVFKYVTQEDEDKLLEIFILATEDAFQKEEEETVSDIMGILMMYMSKTDKKITEDKLMKKIEIMLMLWRLYGLFVITIV